MRARLALGVAAAVILSCGRNTTDTKDAERGSQAARGGAKLQVKLNGFVLDVRGEPPAVPPELEALADAPGRRIVVDLSKKKGEKKIAKRTRLPAPAPRRADGEGGKKWIVQFTGPIHESDRRQLAELGARIVDYLPDFAFLVAMDDAARHRAERIATVNGVLRYRPAYKIARGLKDEDGAVRTGPEPVRVHVRVERAEDLPLALAEVHRAKGKVLDARKDLARVEIGAATVAQLAQLEEVLWIEPAVELRLLNDTSRWTIQTYVPGSTRIWDMGLHGEGEIVGVGDSGLDHDMCFFRDPNGAPIGPTHRKVVGYASLTDDYDGDMGHGTHVCGTVAGDQSPITGASTANGMAPAARIFLTDLGPGESNYVYPPTDLGEMFITPYQAGARLHTNSWGGDSGSYDTYAWSADRFMWEHQDFLGLFANGNSGETNGSVITPAHAKNVVSVGATENGDRAENLAWFSSNGPTWDGRIKPTVTAPGLYVVSADSDGVKGSNNCGTVTFSGTSMATPTVAGAAALVRQYYVQGHYPTGGPRAIDAFVPSAALVKASLMNAAQNMTGDYVDGPIPSPGQGWGRINLSNVLRFTENDRSLEVVDVIQGLATGESWTRSFFASGEQPLKLTLVWTDAAGAPEAERALVNDLDLAVTAPGGAITWLGNVFAGGASAPGGAPDRLNVEEQVYLVAPAAGSYTVSVSGYNVPSGPQPFALVVTGAGGVSPYAFVGMDRQRYNAASEIRIRVADSDLNTDPTRVEEVTVPIRSDTEPAGELVRLVETAPESAIFVARVPTAPAPASASDGVLQVAEGDAIVVEYLDANDGTGVSRTVRAAAVADLTPPVVSAVGVEAIGQASAKVVSTTDEPAIVTVEYGETPALGASVSETWLTTRHAGLLPGLLEARAYRYAVVARDEAGNVTRDAVRTFTTANLPPALEVFSSNSTETYRPETVIFGTATDPSGVVAIAVNGTAPTYRPSDGTYELAVTLSPGPNEFTVVATDGLGNVATKSITVTRLDPPDLVPTSVVGPAHGGMAEAIHVETTVCNQGIGEAPWSGWTGWFLSTDGVYQAEDDVEFDYFFGSGDPIPAGQCLSFGADIRTPGFTSTVGNTYLLGAYADCWNYLWESDETNNGRAFDPIAIDGPDLLLTGLSAPPSAGTAIPFAVTGSMTNPGPGAAYDFDVLFYLSSDETITPQDRVVGFLRSAFMYAGTTNAFTATLTVPSEVPAGRYHLGAIVDPRNFTKESNEANNVFAIGPIDVLGPDLAMAELTGPAAARTGDTIVLHDVVTARATGGNASGFAVVFYLSADSVITTSDIRLASRHVDGLASGGSSAADTVVAIPRTLAGGTYHLGAVVDPDGHVLETDESNNAFDAGTFTLTGPDLAVVSASAPSSGATGATVVVENTVAASAGGGAAPEFYVGIFLSTDPVITATDRVLGWRYVPGLEPGQSSSDLTAVPLPVGLAPGTYYLGVIADDFHAGGCDEWETCWDMEDNAKEPIAADNVALAGAIAIAGPDVALAEVSAPATGFTGQPLVVRSTVTASGGGSGWFQIAFYLSLDATITTSDVRLGTRDVWGLTDGGSSTADTALTVPATLAPGTWFIGAIADSGNAVVEPDESNNVRAGSAVTIRGSDLTVTAVAGPATIPTSAGFPVTTTVVNAGEGSSPASTVLIYLSADATVTTSDLLLGSRTVPALAPSGASTAATTVSVPGYVAPGTYYLGAIVDPYNQVKEANEGNNALAGGTIAVTGPDVFMTAASAPASAFTGSTIAVDQTIAAGPGGPVASASVGIFLSTSLAGGPDDAYLGARYVTNLAAGASSAGSTTVTIPTTLAGGTYYVRVVADPWRSVAESDETNNALVAGTIAIAGPDLVAAAVSGPATASAGSAVTVSDTVVASAAGGAAPEFYVGFFLSSDPLVTEADLWIGSRWLGGLAPGGSSSASTVVTIPANLAPGTYYLGMIVDDFATYIGDEWDGYYVHDNAKESDETNNTLSGGTIVVGAPGT
jgi:subtilase family serine protease